MFGDDSMPDLADVYKANNVARLAEQLEGVTTIVALSAPAIAGVKEAGIQPTYNHTLHPGMRGLNNYYTGLGKDAQGAACRRTMPTLRRGTHSVPRLTREPVRENAASDSSYGSH